MKYVIEKIPLKEKKEPENKEKKEEPKRPKPKSIFKKKLYIKHGKKNTKLKLRTKSYLVTYVPENKETLTKVLQNIPTSIEKIEISKKTEKKRKAEKKAKSA